MYGNHPAQMLSTEELLFSPCFPVRVKDSITEKHSALEESSRQRVGDDNGVLVNVEQPECQEEGGGGPNV